MNQQKYKLRVVPLLIALIALVVGIQLLLPMQHSTAVMMDKFITVYGQKIHYVESGSGATVILLHNMGGDVSDWDKTIPALSKKYHVIAFDQIGAGQSDHPLINYRPATWVNFLEGIYRELKIERASLVGHSLNGSVAALFALKQPEKVDRLVLVDAGYGYAIPQVSDSRLLGHAPGTLPLLNPSTLEQMRQAARLAFYDQKTYANDTAIDKMFASSIRGGYTQQRFIESIMRREDVLDNQLGQIRQPTLIVWGREDGWTPLALGNRFQQEIPGSKLLVLDRCGHFATIEKPDQFNAAVMTFLDGQ